MKCRISQTGRTAQKVLEKEREIMEKKRKVRHKTRRKRRNRIPEKKKREHDINKSAFVKANEIHKKSQ